jgi:hypothetical protein
MARKEGMGLAVPRDAIVAYAALHGLRIDG